MKFSATLLGIAASKLTKWQSNHPNQVFIDPDDDIRDAHGHQGEYGDLMVAPWQVPIFVEKFGMEEDKMQIDPDAGKEEALEMTGRAVPHFAKKWNYINDEGKIRIPYFIDQTVPERYHRRIHNALDEFTRAVGCFEMYFDADLHHWHGIHVFGGEDGGCWSYVGLCRNCGSTTYAALGMRHGWQALRLPNWCFGVGGVHHEFLHALGFLHEQDRPDVYNYFKPKDGDDPMVKSEWLNTGHPFEPRSAVMYSGYTLLNGGSYRSAAMLTTTDAEQLDSFYCHDPHVPASDIPPRGQCLSGDVLGYFRPIFHHRLCDK
ncbi:unnamed protein product, partial [Oikopleura dioica]